jgi:hypothetical protein
MCEGLILINRPSLKMKIVGAGSFWHQARQLYLWFRSVLGHAIVMSQNGTDQQTDQRREMKKGPQRTSTFASLW